MKSVLWLGGDYLFGKLFSKQRLQSSSTKNLSFKSALLVVILPHRRSTTIAEETNPYILK